MEREEVETIPWSNLVMEPASRVDRRWAAYGVIGVALVVSFLGFRALTTGGQPTPQAASAPVTTTVAAPDPTMVVSEDELRSSTGEDALVALRAEWFVTDFFTSDGSPETDRSLRSALHPTVEGVDLAAVRPMAGSETFVEWAKAVEVTIDGTGYRAVVAYRSLTQVGRDYRREPVHAVEVGVQLVDGVPMITTLPTEVEAFWGSDSAG